MIGVYLHVPYCRTLCPYCDFNRVRIDEAPPEAYVDALVTEIETFSARDTAETVFIGGGTPSLLRLHQLDRILQAVRKRFVLPEPEITIEANPDDVTPALAEGWSGLGVNRVSLGVQSFDDAVLRYLGRRHNAAVARDACETVAERFGNWSMDLIYGAPPVLSWEATLAECAVFAPPHVSCYGLTYEKGTPFGARAGEAIDDDVALECYRLIREVLRDYERYEVSNFARPGYVCRHNLYYWRNLEYAGFGPGAYSFIAGIRSMNEISPDAYMKGPGMKADVEPLSEHDVRVETLIQHFRLREGLTRGAYLARFGSPLEEDFGPVLKGLVARGLLEECNERLRPTDLGFELNNEIGLALVG
ncbi:MAG: radical SAM family heme chaperone HemW [Candidatus Hydrogenedentota bacterium]